MMHEHFREALEQLDVPLVRKIWRHVFPNMPQPASDDEALISLHMARSAARSIGFRARAYSHVWLVERGFPSQLPDELRPRAERIYPVIVPTVGIAVRHRTPVALAIRQSMEEAVLDVGVKNPIETKRAIMAARARTRKKLLGV
jgi:hypothetical protein